MFLKFTVSPSVLGTLIFVLRGLGALAVDTSWPHCQSICAEDPVQILLNSSASKAVNAETTKLKSLSRWERLISASVQTSADLLLCIFFSFL